MLSARLLVRSVHDDDLRCFLVVSVAIWRLALRSNFMFEQFRVCFCYGRSVGFLPDWVFQNSRTVYLLGQLTRLMGNMLSSGLVAGIFLHFSVRRQQNPPLKSVR